MERKQAVRILEAVRDGVDPDTGEELPADSPFQRPDVVRALFTVLSLLKAADGLSRRRRPQAPNAGQPWTDEDDVRLGEAFDGGASPVELAETFGRSRTAIRARLVQLGRLDANAVSLRYPLPEAKAAVAT